MTTNYHTPLETQVEASSTVFEGAFGALDSALSAMTEGQPLIKLFNLASSTLTIASGVVTATRSAHLIDTEAAAAADDLDTINGGADGDILFLRPANAARDVVLRSGFGNIAMQSLVTRLSGSKQVALVKQGGYWKDILNRNVAGIEVPIVPKTEISVDTASPLFDIRGIPAGFSYLRLLVGQRPPSGSNGVAVYANGDTGNNYQRTRVSVGDVGSPSYLNPTSIVELVTVPATQPAGYFSVNVIDIYNYDQPTKYKNFVGAHTLNSVGSAEYRWIFTTWKNNTVALDRLYGHGAGVTLAAGSWYALYGML